MSFPKSFREAYKYKGGFDKFVYDTLKELGNYDEEEFVPVIYAFTSYADSKGETEWGTGTVETTGVVKGNYTEVEVLTNSTDDSFVGEKFFIRSSAKTDGTIYKLYNDAGKTSANIYVSIAPPEEQQEQTKE